MRGLPFKLSMQIGAAFLLAQLCFGQDFANTELLHLQSGSEDYDLILGRRLIDPPHWKKGIEEGHWPAREAWTMPAPTVFDPTRKPYHAYGRESFSHFKKAYKQVLENAGRIPTLENYLELHRLSFFNFPGDLFWGFYKDQIHKKYKDSPIDRDRFLKMLNDSESSPDGLARLMKEAKLISGRGRLRTYGDTSWSGNPWGIAENKRVSLTVEEFSRYRAKKWLRAKVYEVNANRIDAVFWHPKGEQVPELLAALFHETEQRAKFLKANRGNLGELYPSASFQLAAEFYIDLLLIHGFWDGVGRASKLIRDQLLFYLELPPPFETPSNDMLLESSEYAKILAQESQKTAQHMKLLHTRIGQENKKSLKRGCFQL